MPDLFRSLHDAIARAAQDAILVVDQQERIVMINPAAQRMFRCTAAEALGTGLSRFIPVRHRAAHSDHVRAFDASGASELPSVKRRPVVGLRSDGEQFPLEAEVSRLEVAGASAEVHHFIAVLRDISEIDGLHAEVEMLQQRLLEIIELAPVAIWITEEERITYANRCCELLFCVEGKQSLVGRCIYDFLHEDSREPVRQAIRTALDSNTLRPLLRERIRQRDGEVRTIDIALAPLAFGSRSALQMVLTDVTDDARAARDLLGAHVHLRRLATRAVVLREKERLRVAHALHEELGQQLVAIQMELGALSRTLPPDCAQRLSAAGVIAAQAVSSMRRIASELHPMILEQLGLHAALEALVEDSQQVLGIGIGLTTDLADDPVASHTDIGIYRMVQEALPPVAHHARTWKVQVDLRTEAGEIRLAVRAAGDGDIAAGQPALQAHDLHGVQELAEMFGGRMTVDVDPDGGVGVSVTLPADSAHPPVDAGGALP